MKSAKQLGIILMSLASITATQAAIEDGVILYYNFDTPVSDVVQDASGNGNYAEITGTTFEPAGRVGGAFAFDGLDDRLVVVNPYIIEPWNNPQYTVSLWFQSESEVNFTENRRLIGDNRRYEIAAGISGDNKVLFTFADNFADCCFGDPVVSTPLAIQPFTWQHVALVVNADQEPSVNMYLNGQLVASSPSSGANYGGYGLMIGASFDYDNFIPGFNWAGLIDEVRIYNRAITAEEIIELSNPINGGGGGDCDECEECEECEVCEECEECEECDVVQSSILRVHVGTSAEGEGNVTSFQKTDTLFVRVVDAGLSANDPKISVRAIVSPKSAKNKDLKVDLAAQPDGSFLGSTSLSSMPSGEAKLIIQGRASDQERRKIDTSITIE